MTDVFLNPTTKVSRPYPNCFPSTSADEEGEEGGRPRSAAGSILVAGWAFEGNELLSADKVNKRAPHTQTQSTNGGESPNHTFMPRSCT